MGKEILEFQIKEACLDLQNNPNLRIISQRRSQKEFHNNLFQQAQCINQFTISQSTII